MTNASSNERVSLAKRAVFEIKDGFGEEQILEMKKALTDDVDDDKSLAEVLHLESGASAVEVALQLLAVASARHAEDVGRPQLTCAGLGSLLDQITVATNAAAAFLFPKDDIDAGTRARSEARDKVADAQKRRAAILEEAKD